MKDEPKCPACGGRVKHYDYLTRLVRGKNGKKDWVEIERLRCEQCGEIHRDLPNDIFPYKQYDGEIIRGVLDGFITPDTIGYEDYPCEATMTRWLSQKSQLLLWKHTFERKEGAYDKQGGTAYEY